MLGASSPNGWRVRRQASSLCTFPRTSEDLAQGYPSLLSYWTVGFLEFTQFFNHGFPWKLQFVKCLQPPALPLSYRGTYLLLYNKHQEKQLSYFLLKGRVDSSYSKKSTFLQKKSRQLPTLPQGCPCSTIGAKELNFRVRNGNGCFLLAITTGKKVQVNYS